MRYYNNIRQFELTFTIKLRNIGKSPPDGTRPEAPTSSISYTVNLANLLIALVAITLTVYLATPIYKSIQTDIRGLKTWSFDYRRRHNLLTPAEAYAWDHRPISSDNDYDYDGEDVCDFGNGVFD